MDVIVDKHTIGGWFIDRQVMMCGDTQLTVNDEHDEHEAHAMRNKRQCAQPTPAHDSRGTCNVPGAEELAKGHDMCQTQAQDRETSCVCGKKHRHSRSWMQASMSNPRH